jgi:hypothetical protein
MTKAEAKKKILNMLLDELEADDEALFGELGSKGDRLMIDSQEWRCLDAARVELQREFRRRTR